MVCFFWERDLFLEVFWYAEEKFLGARDETLMIKLFLQKYIHIFRCVGFFLFCRQMVFCQFRSFSATRGFFYRNGVNYLNVTVHLRWGHIWVKVSSAYWETPENRFKKKKIINSRFHQSEYLWFFVFSFSRFPPYIFIFSLLRNP